MAEESERPIVQESFLMAQIRPPIIVDDRGSITLYRDVEFAAADLEPIDVANNEYEFSLTASAVGYVALSKEIGW